MILGIDPGVNGAFALYTYTDGKFAISTYDMPTLRITVSGSTRQKLDLAAVSTFLTTHRLTIDHAVIEDVHAMPQDGPVGAFSFGFVCGALQAMLVAFEIPTTTISPAIWKRKLGVTSDKDETRRRASQLFPRFADQWALKKHDGRAEAALIAFWAHREGMAL